MKTSGWIWVTFLASSVLSIERVEFESPVTASLETNKRAYEVLQLLKRTENNCPTGYSPCTDLGDSDICCRTNAICTSDDANHIACCPVGASCTGTLTDPSTGTGSFQFPQSTSATTTTSGGSEATITGSTLSGAYPFVYVPTTFSNADVCSSYYTQCQSEYTACITSLGGGYGVTVSGGGAELTRSGGAAGAVETCSSLSLAACHGLNLGYCGNYAGGSSSDGVSRRASNLQDLLFGVVIGITGMFI